MLFIKLNASCSLVVFLIRTTKQEQRGVLITFLYVYVYICIYFSFYIGNCVCTTFGAMFGFKLDMTFFRFEFGPWVDLSKVSQPLVGSVGMVKKPINPA